MSDHLYFSHQFTCNPARWLPLPSTQLHDRYQLVPNRVIQHDYLMHQASRFFVFLYNPGYLMLSRSKTWPATCPFGPFNPPMIDFFFTTWCREICQVPDSQPFLDSHHPFDLSISCTVRFRIFGLHPFTFPQSATACLHIQYHSRGCLSFYGHTASP